ELNAHLAVGARDELRIEERGFLQVLASGDAFETGPAGAAAIPADVARIDLFGFPPELGLVAVPVSEGAHGVGAKPLAILGLGGHRRHSGGHRPLRHFHAAPGETAALARELVAPEVGDDVIGERAVLPGHVLVADRPAALEVLQLNQYVLRLGN